MSNDLKNVTMTSDNGQRFFEITGQKDIGQSFQHKSGQNRDKKSRQADREFLKYTY